jgi:hypothetical protein
MRLLEFTTTGPDEIDRRVQVDGDENEVQNTLHITYVIAEGETETQFELAVDFPGNQIHLTLPHGATAYAICVATCVGGHLVQEVLDCLKNGHRTPRALLQCLKKKGVQITIDLAKCATSCLGAAPNP